MADIFLLWLVLLNKMPSRSIHVFKNGGSSFLLVAEQYSLDMYATSSLSVPRFGHLSCVHILAIVSYAAWIWECIYFFDILMSFCLDIYLEGGCDLLGKRKVFKILRTEWWPNGRQWYTTQVSLWGCIVSVGSWKPTLPLVGLMDRRGDKGIFQINSCHTRNQGMREVARAVKPHLVQQWKFHS